MLHFVLSTKMLRIISIFLSYVAITVFGALALLYFYAKYKQTYWSKRGVYSPPCHWLFGHFKDALTMKKSFADAFAALHNCTDINTPVVGVYIMQKPFLLLRSPKIMKQIFIKDFHIFCNRYFASKRKADIIGCEGLFSIENPQWKYTRAKLSPAFSSVKLKKLFPHMIESAENMQKYLKSQVSEGERVTIECRQLSDKYTTDVISSFSFGILTNSFAKPEPEFYVRSRKVFGLGLLRSIQIFSTFFFPKIGDLLRGSMLDDSTDYFRDIFWESMNEREKSGAKRGDIIDLLIELKNEEQSTEFKFEGDYLVAQSAILLVAGLESSAITMGFTLLELAKHPDIQLNVHEEIRKILCENGFTYESVWKMTYLSQVISETLRLYPPAPIIDRVATEDYKIPGTDIVIEKGMGVYASLKGIHEDPHYHRDPLTYDPERFRDDRRRTIEPCTYMPFGEGPRICIGMRIGQLQTLVGLITILKDYEVTLNENYKTEINIRAMILAPVDGIKLYFKRIHLGQ